jgi:hypothetical protein
MHTDARTRLASSQLELVQALVGNGAKPAEFDASRIQATADALLLKRTHSVARSWPSLARSLGPAFDERFSNYARSRPPLHDGGPLADGRAFARAVAQDVALADDAALEALLFDLRYRISEERVVARRGFFFGLAQLNQSQRLVIGIRLPLFGERLINLPLQIL